MWGPQAAGIGLPSPGSRCGRTGSYFLPGACIYPTRAWGLPAPVPAIHPAEGTAHLLLSQNLRTLLGFEDAWVLMMDSKRECANSCPSMWSRPLKNQCRLCSLQG